MTVNAPRPRQRGSAAWMALLTALVIVGAVIIGLNLGGRGPTASLEPSPSGSASLPAETGSATDSASPTASATPAAPDLAWERLDGVLDAGASVFGVTNLSGRWFATGRIGNAPAIWASDDDVPRTWTTTTIDTPENADQMVQVTDVVPIGDDLLAIGAWGAIDSDQFSWISWRSTDGGATWRESRRDEFALHTLTQGGPGLIGAAWAYGGTTPFDSQIELSADGTNWRILAPAAMRNAEVTALSAIGDRLVAVGAGFGIDGLTPAAWYSDDAGQTWTIAEVSGGSGLLADVTQVGQGLVAVGGSGVPTAWTTIDGVSWTAHEMGGVGVVAAVAPMESGGVVAVGNAGAQDIGPEHAWSSLDGITWLDGGDLPTAFSRMMGVAGYGTSGVAGGLCLGGDEPCDTPLWVGTRKE
jgi:hypothetical protein